MNDKNRGRPSSSPIDSSGGNPSARTGNGSAARLGARTRAPSNLQALWKYLTVAVALLLALFYSAPSVYRSAPTIQLRPLSGVDVELEKVLGESERAMRTAGVEDFEIILGSNAVEIRFPVGADSAQAAAQRALDAALGDRMVVALSSDTTAPGFFRALGAEPIALGLDLRGGIHFLLQVDIDFAVSRALEGELEAIKGELRERRIRYRAAEVEEDAIRLAFADVEKAAEAAAVLAEEQFRAVVVDGTAVAELVLRLPEEVVEEIRDLTVKQNLETLRNRVDELGVAEPVITRQGDSRIAVQLPGVQDTARAKAILGRTAALELRGVDEARTASRSAIVAARSGQAPRETILVDGDPPYLLEDSVVVSGENIINAHPSFDQSGRPAVSIDLDNVGGARMRAYTRSNVGDRLAIVMIERRRSEVISAPVIQEELSARFIIHGSMTSTEATELALLLRAGSLSAPLLIIEERTVGPSLGADNIRSGLGSIQGGFIAIAVFIAAYYMAFGLVSVAALSANLLCLTALLATLQATLTLPGLAGFALTLGMAIDANVLINERIREELARGTRPLTAIREGYDRAFLTILDANITTLIAGIALFAFGSGPVRGFAVVLSLGLITSMFTAVIVSRCLVDLVYSRRSRFKTLSIG